MSQRGKKYKKENGVKNGAGNCVGRFATGANREPVREASGQFAALARAPSTIFGGASSGYERAPPLGGSCFGTGAEFPPVVKHSTGSQRLEVLRSGPSLTIGSGACNDPATSSPMHLENGDLTQPHGASGRNAGHGLAGNVHVNVMQRMTAFKTPVGGASAAQGVPPATANASRGENSIPNRNSHDRGLGRRRISAAPFKVVKNKARATTFNISAEGKVKESRQQKKVEAFYVMFADMETEDALILRGEGMERYVQAMDRVPGPGFPVSPKKDSRIAPYIVALETIPWYFHDEQKPLSYKVAARGLACHPSSEFHHWETRQAELHGWQAMALEQVSDKFGSHVSANVGLMRQGARGSSGATALQMYTTFEEFSSRLAGIIAWVLYCRHRVWRGQHLGTDWTSAEQVKQDWGPDVLRRWLSLEQRRMRKVRGDV